jgi:hypothetical protein
VTAPEFAGDTVVELAAHVPQEVRRLAKFAYTARRRFYEAQRQYGAAMREFADACLEFHLDPSQIQVGEFSGESLVPAGMDDCRNQGRGGRKL